MLFSSSALPLRPLWLSGSRNERSHLLPSLIGATILSLRFGFIHLRVECSLSSKGQKKGVL
ncbi:MAG: hypothetical protein ACI8WB_004258 [Phenylobacterium sp.]|jgi:hypothetical protein